MGRILKYNEVKFQVMRLISERGLEQNDRLPSERDLASQFGVSIISIRRALQDLEASGVVSRVQGVGSFFSGKLQKETFTNTLGIVSIDDFRFPSGEDMNIMREALRKYRADYRVFNVKSELDISIVGSLAECDRLLVSGFINLPWLDYLFSLGKPLVQIGVSEHNRPVSQVKFDWDAAFEAMISRLAAKGKKRIGLLLINPSSANCSFERAQIFQNAMRAHGLAHDEAHIRFIVPERAISHAGEYMQSFGLELDAILIDYHVFNIWTFANLVGRFRNIPELVIMQTVRELRDEVNQIPGFSQLYFPNILKAAAEMLYDYPISFIGDKKSLSLQPILEGALSHVRLRQHPVPAF